MFIQWALISLLLSYQLPACLSSCDGRCLRSPSMPLYRLVPVGLPEDHAELLRQTRQQNIVQEVVVENNFNGFGSPAFGGPPFGGPPFGGPPFAGPPFGGASGFGRGGRPRGGFSGGFGGGFGGGFSGGFGRSYDSDEEQQPPPAKSKPSSVPAPPCANNYIFSCEPLLKQVPCAAPHAKCGY